MADDSNNTAHGLVPNSQHYPGLLPKTTLPILDCGLIVRLEEPADLIGTEMSCLKSEEAERAQLQAAGLRNR
ncbi:hypothetical protein EJ076_10500 [Mesorhizobium sp. M7D.F.Ca.US.005.01.1.1]|uniref:hypothetical protein n=1 Tax=Mesorhizobium sp. M7D.F.Ca.US.005.01.1.1 TaxID=2493678 RepID=UPI000F763329|nr:hypothetical protein [Mesorhizobium sp. M7D.F.Ca.US.005.01.1.1]AZO41507.1 hypothetical protein EJ076_10500 [Mesorhizobium sp. M7D.F.Ca.US.005.01.1.1]